MLDDLQQLKGHDGIGKCDPRFLAVVPLICCISITIHLPFKDCHCRRSHVISGRQEVNFYDVSTNLLLVGSWRFAYLQLFVRHLKFTHITEVT